MLLDRTPENLVVFDLGIEKDAKNEERHEGKNACPRSTVACRQYAFAVIVGESGEKRWKSHSQELNTMIQEV